MGRIEVLFEELNFPGADRLKKALKNRKIPFTKEQVEKLTKASLYDRSNKLPHP